jgi:hypothetical protein
MQTKGLQQSKICGLIGKVNHARPRCWETLKLYFNYGKNIFPEPLLRHTEIKIAHKNHSLSFLYQTAQFLLE